MLEQAKALNFDYFIDIGANFGLYSCVFGVSDTVQKIHSFECDPRNVLHLYGHIRMNGLMDKVIVHPYAVGDRETNITFKMASSDSTGHSHVENSAADYEKMHLENQTSDYKFITVEQRSLDTDLGYTGKRLICKIDVEGYEKVVLKGMKNTLENNLCLLQIEIANDADAKAQFLSAMGYRVIHKIGIDWYFTNIAA